MAYNNLSGTVHLPNELLKIEGYTAGIVSGNLSTSDGADIINVPRVSNAVNNGLVIDTGGDANTLRCDGNLTFDGTTLNVVGDITASIGISASIFVGDGSGLTNLPGGGSGAGIFTEINGTQAYTTSSIVVGANTTPVATMHVEGSSFMSGAVIHKRKFTNSDYTATTTDYYVGVDSSGATVKITLPTATNMLDGQTLIIKDEGGSADTNNITISGSASDTIDGQNQVVLESPFASIQLYCNGTDKFFIC